MMTHLLILAGLVLALGGSICLVSETWGADAAQIRSWYKEHASQELRGGFAKQLAFRVARRFASEDVWKQQVLLGESFPRKFWGLLLLMLGFVLQAAGVVVELMLK